MPFMNLKPPHTCNPIHCGLCLPCNAGISAFYSDFTFLVYNIIPLLYFYWINKRYYQELRLTVQQKSRICQITHHNSMGYTTAPNYAAYATDNR